MSYVNKITSANHNRLSPQYRDYADEAIRQDAFSGHPDNLMHDQTHDLIRDSANSNIYSEDQPPVPLIQAIMQSPSSMNKLMAIFASLVFTVIIISFRPFDRATSPTDFAASGDTVNQVGYVAIFGIMGILLLSNVSPRRLLSFARPLWAIFLIAVLAAVMQNPSPFTAMRTVLLTLFAAFAAFAVLVLPHSKRDLKMVITITSILILGMSYAGLVLLPDVAKHGYSAFEAQHFGLWRGPFPHKNIAGPIMSILAIFGIYIWRSGSPLLGALLTLAAFIFVLNTGSKTTSGFLPISVLIILSAGLFASARMAVVATILAVTTIGLLTIGTLYSDTLAGITASILDDATFTGRLTLWRHGIITFLSNPMGEGFNNFWNTSAVLNGPLPGYADWDFREIVHGHNNYIDVLLNYGLVGGAVIFFTLFVMPMVNYISIYKAGAERKLADMFMMMIVFIMLLSFMETFILHRSDPIWIFHVFAVFGLQMLATELGKTKQKKIRIF